MFKAKHLIEEGAPSVEEFQKLYGLIGEFRSSKPYEVLGSDNCFGIRRESGDIIWCIVMGMAGEEYGISLFYGDKSLGAFYDLVTNPPCPDMAPFRNLDGTYFNLVNKKELEAADLNVLEKNGFTTYGRGRGWALIRRYLPGHVMSEEISSRDLQALVLFLEQIPAVCDDLRNREVVWNFDGEGGAYPVLEIRGGERHWEVVEPDYSPELGDIPAADPFKANRMLKMKSTESDIFIGAPMLFTPIEEQNPPSLPECMILVDTGTGAILTFNIFEYGSDYNLQRINAIVDFFVDAEFRPERILVESEVLAKALSALFINSDTEVILIAPPEAYYDTLDELLGMMNGSFGV